MHSNEHGTCIYTVVPLVTSKQVIILQPRQTVVKPEVLHSSECLSCYCEISCQEQTRILAMYRGSLVPRSLPHSKEGKGLVHIEHFLGAQDATYLLLSCTAIVGCTAVSKLIGTSVFKTSPKQHSMCTNPFSSLRVGFGNELYYRGLIKAIKMGMIFIKWVWIEISC